MGDVVTLTARRRGRAERRIRGGSGIVHAFPGTRHLRMINNIVAYMATLDDVKAEEFLVSHFEIEDRRLTAQGIPDPEIEKYIFTAAREIWLRLRTVKAGVA
jgi:hypothetical protein